MLFTPTAYYSSLTIDYTSNIVAWYNFNGNASGSTTPPYHGTPTNMSFIDTGITGEPTDFSATFNGSTSYITVADADDFSFGTGAFSINFWIYNPSAIQAAYLISKRFGTGGGDPLEYQMLLDNSIITLFLYNNNTGTAYIRVENDTPIPTNTWTMITYTFLGGTSYNDFYCYVNGIDKSSRGFFNTYTTGMVNTTAPVTIGKQGNVGSSYFTGQLDQLRIWKGKALNSAEVSKIYTDKF